MVNINIKLPNKLHKQFRIKVLEENIFIKDKVIQLIEKYVEDKNERNEIHGIIINDNTISTNSNS